MVSIGLFLRYCEVVRIGLFLRYCEVVRIYRLVPQTRQSFPCVLIAVQWRVVKFTEV